MYTGSSLAQSLNLLKISLDSEPVSSYSERILKSISLLQTNSKDVSIHRAKFAECARYTLDLQVALVHNQEMPLSLQCARQLERFSQELFEFTEFSANCTDLNHTVLSDETLPNTFRRFFDFWGAMVKVIQIFEKDKFFDVAELFAAHLKDIEYIRNAIDREEFPDRVKEAEDTLAALAGYLDLSKIKITKLICQTPFSYIVATNTNCILEIFAHGNFDSEIFRKYVALLRDIKPHPNLLKFVNSTNTLPYAIAYEHSSGGTLAEKLKAKSLNPTELSTVLLEIARAIEYLHSIGITHRNLSPDVVFLTPDNHVKVGGLWIAGKDTQKDGKIVPFTCYQAPELLIDDNEYNQHIDVYSFTFMTWQIITGQVPFAGMRDSDVMRNVIRKDLRPQLPHDAKICGFFLCGWSRNPNSRPNFSEIVRMIESKQLWVEGTDESALSGFISDTMECQDAALKGILSISIESVRSMRGKDLAEKDLDVLCNVILDGRDRAIMQEAEAILRAEARKPIKWSAKIMAKAVQVSAVVQGFEAEVAGHLRFMSDNVLEFVRNLFATTPQQQALTFCFRYLLADDEVCKFLFEYGSDKSDAVATNIADEITRAKPNSDIIFNYIHNNKVYYQRALTKLMSYSPEELNIKCEYLIPMSERADPETFAKIAALVMKIDKKQNPNFDENCILFARMVIRGYGNHVVSFAANPTYCKRFVQVLLPQLVDTQYSFVLKIVLTVVSHYKSLVPMIMQHNLLKVIHGCIGNGELELAQQAIFSIPFPSDVFHANKAIADDIIQRLGRAKSTSESACLCAILTQWSLREAIKITPEAARSISDVIKKCDLAEVTRVMPCAAYIVSKDVESAKLLATPENFVGAISMCASRQPEHVTPAICFGLYISRWLVITEVTQPQMKDALQKEIALVQEGKVDAMVLSYILQTLAGLPESPIVASMISQLNMRDLVTIATTNPSYTASETVRKSVDRLRMANRA